MEEIRQQVSKFKRSQLIYAFFSLVSIGAWAYYYSHNNLGVKIVDDNFLPSMSISQICLSCAILLFYALTKSNIRFKRVYIILLVILYITLIADTVILNIVWILNSDLFSSSQKYSLCIIMTTIASILFSLLLIKNEVKLQTLICQLIVLYRIQLIRELLDDPERDIGDNDESQIQRQIRVQSVEQSQLNNVYGQICTICDEETSQDKKAIQLQCLHIFHSECIRKWLDKSSVCPNCRKEVLAE